MKKRENEESAAQSAIILAGVVIVVAVLAVLFGLQTLVWINAKHWASVDAWLNDTPQPLPALANAVPLPPAPLDKKGKPIGPPQLRAYDYEFSPPWPGNSKTVPTDTFVQFRFDSGQVIAFLDPGAQIDVVRQMKTGETTQYNQFSNVSQPVAKFELRPLQHRLLASPAKISPGMHSQDAFRDNVLLLWKLSFGFDMQPGIHTVAGGKNRGRVWRSHQRKTGGVAAIRRGRQASSIHFHRGGRFERLDNAGRHRQGGAVVQADSCHGTLTPEA